MTFLHRLVAKVNERVLRRVEERSVRLRVNGNYVVRVLLHWVEQLVGRVATVQRQVHVEHGHLQRQHVALSVLEVVNVLQIEDL